MHIPLGAGSVETEAQDTVGNTYGNPLGGEPGLEFRKLDIRTWLETQDGAAILGFGRSQTLPPQVCEHGLHQIVKPLNSLEDPTWSLLQKVSHGGRQAFVADAVDTAALQGRRVSRPRVSLIRNAPELPVD